MSARLDAIIIGTGQAGPSLAARLAGAGKKVAIIERKRFGGTCVNTGCMPTKTLVVSAYAARIARRGADFGVMIDAPIKVDMKRVKARKDEVAGRASRNVESWLKGISNLRVIEGHARFESPAAVRVNDESSMTSCAPACPAFGQSVTATGAVRSRTLPTTISRSSPTTCSTARGAVSRTA